MTPRHPPRALGGLTTPTRPPRRPGARGPRSPSGPARRGPDLPSVPRPAASCDAAGRPFLRLRVDASPPSTGGPDVSPRVRREIDTCHYHADSRIRDACVTDDRIVKDATGGRRRVPPGVAPGPDPSRPPPGRWPGGEAAAAAAPPRTQRGRDGSERSDRPDRRPPRRIRGGRRPVGRSRSLVERSGTAASARPTNLGGSRRRPSGREGRCRRRSRSPEGRADRGVGVILRKEVIQPQVPLRLPCYDLVPITGFIFGACL